MNQVITEHLVPATQRIRYRRFWLTLSCCWLLTALLGLLLIAANRWMDLYWSTMSLTLGLVFLLLSCLGIFLAWPRRSDYSLAATRIEQRFPDLDMTLMTALEMKPLMRGRPLSYLQQTVIRNAIYHSFQNSWAKAIPAWQVFFGPFMAAVSLILAIASLVYLIGWSHVPEVSGGVTSFDEAVIVDSELSVIIEPGHTDIERGTSMLVLARFQKRIPPKAVLNIEYPSGDSRQIAMFKSLSDPVFAARVDNVDQPFDYYVSYESSQTDRFHVGVFELPRLVRADAILDYPDYTELEDATVQDVRRISAVQGTVAKLICQLNKETTSVYLKDRDGTRFELLPSPGPIPAYSVDIPFKESTRMELHLVDDKGRANRTPPEFVINVLKNQPAKIKLIQPVRDLEVSPLEELITSAEAWDDFGLKQIGISLSWAGEGERDFVLATNAPAKQPAEVGHMISMEELGAKPDSLLAYYYWADDVGPDGKIRRTASDMFFAEVRPFEEIFRQGDQPTAGQMQQQQQQNQQGNQNAAQAGELAEIQKQIINATWKIIRDETGSQRRDDFIDNLETIIQSQVSLIEQVEALSSQVQDPQSLEHIGEVKTQMNEAVKFLSQSHQSSEVEPLSDALMSEQLAYQALLRTRAREHEVVRNQQQQQQPQSGNANSRSQQQLQQLELSNDENRYETQSVAQQQQESVEQREDRQILNRLRELARRQSYLNERIKELQTELEKAQTDEEREEIERQLKRLREEQQQILRDTDELRERMDQPENQQRMSEQAEQVDRARENIRQASEALEQGQVSRAAAEGTRAENELRELRDEFQNRNSSQFAEEMREMRNEAQDIDERQQELGERLDDLQMNQSESRSLRDVDETEQISEEFNRQRDRIENLQDQMRDTIERAEEIEPLLAQELYDTYRQAQQDVPEDALDSANRSLRGGFVEDADREQRRAAQGIDRIREGVERAAESVLGDETQALRRANEELERLSDEINNELERNDPESQDANQESSQDSQPRGNTGENSGDQRSDENRDPSEQDRQGEPGDQQRQEGDPQGRPGESSDSESQSDQNQQPGDRSQGGNPNQEDSDQQQRGSAGDRQQQPRDNQTGQQVRNPNGLGGGDPNQRFNPEFMPAPLTGEDYLDWSDRLRDVEEMISDPDLRAEAARIRDRAKAIRKDFKRHSEEPNWDLVRMQIAGPLVELQEQVRLEILRRSDKKSLVPIDREPVPGNFEEAVRKYYEQLGTGR